MKYPQKEEPEITKNAENKEQIDSIKSGYVQWLYNGATLMPEKETTKTAPPGMYSIDWDSEHGLPVLRSMPFNADQLFILPIPVIEKAIKDVRAFWDSQEKYIGIKSVYKRGLLLYGLPGCGKSSIIMLLAKEIITRHGGIVLIPQDVDQIVRLMKLIPILRDIEPLKKIIVVIEDIDNYVGEGRNYEQSSLLNFLDGASCQNGIVTIATTNYPEKLQERITNRPSRFDRRYEVGKPDTEVREFYLRNKLENIPDKIDEEEIKRIAKETEGLTIDHLKEYVLSRFVLGYSHEEAISEISDIASTKILKNTKQEQVGFLTKNVKN